jgi:hypothetical protein
MNERVLRCLRPPLVLTLLTLGVMMALPAKPAAGADFAESRSAWAVAPPFGENNLPGVERDGTLRIIRFSNDRQILGDPGTLIGFTSIFVRTGELSPTHEQPSDEKSLLEIMRHVEMPKE